MRRGHSVLEIAIVIGAIAILAAWAVPRLRTTDVVAADVEAQAWADAAVDAVAAARRDLGDFRDETVAADLALYDRYATVELALVDRNTTALVANGTGRRQVSIAVIPTSSPDHPFGEVVAASVAADGGPARCWVLRRGFGTTFSGSEVVHGYEDGSTDCRAGRFVTLVPSGGLGSAWTEPVRWP